MNVRANDVIDALESMLAIGLEHNQFMLLFMRASNETIEIMQDGPGDVVAKPDYQQYVKPFIQMFSDVLGIDISECDWLKLKLSFDPEDVYIERGEYLNKWKLGKTLGKSE